MVAVLLRSERSWRLALVRSVLIAAADDAVVVGPLGGLDAGWAILERAAEARPALIEELLARPEVGLWAAHTIRRIRMNPSSDVPLWVDLGYLHALAAAAAIRAGLMAEIDIPVRHGTASIPTVGAATVPLDTAFGTARVRTGDGAAEISAGRTVVQTGASCPGWHEPVRVHVIEDGIGLDVELADRDAYRDLRGPAAARPLDEAETARWRATLGKAWATLVRDHRPSARAIAAGVQVLSPVPAKEAFRQLSASGGEAFGGILLSFPDDSTQLAVTLVHEFQHQKLGALLHLLTLTAERPDIRYYAGWRDDPRPVSGLLQGAYAFAGVTDFWRSPRSRCHPNEEALAHLEFALWRRQTLLVVRTLAGSEQLTEYGEWFVETLLKQVDEHQSEPVPHPESMLAADLALDHSALWRAHNIVVSGDAVAELVTAWERGAPAPIPDESSSTVRAAPDVGMLDTRAVLARYRLTRPNTFEAFRENPRSVARTVAGATDADVALVAGDRNAASHGYLARLDARPDDIHALVGLGMTRPDHSTDPAGRALLGRPELVRALGRRLAESGPTDVLGLAAWIGGSLPMARTDPAGWRTAQTRA